MVTMYTDDAIPALLFSISDRSQPRLENLLLSTFVSSNRASDLIHLFAAGDHLGLRRDRRGSG